MTGSVSLPLWSVLLLGLLAAWAVLDRVLVPSVRWYLRRRVNRVIDELNTRLKLEIPPFHRTRRQVLIDRLVYDPKVIQAVDEEARNQQGIPRAVLAARVKRYAREIVPAFNAYFYFRVGYWVSKRVARSLYRVRLGFSDEAGLAGVAPGSTVVFLMNHRSNMDYVLVSYLVAERIARPSNSPMSMASFSLSAPRSGWNSTSTPRSRKTLTAVSDKASEMSTRGVIHLIPWYVTEAYGR